MYLSLLWILHIIFNYFIHISQDASTFYLFNVKFELPKPLEYEIVKVMEFSWMDIKTLPNRFNETNSKKKAVLIWFFYMKLCIILLVIYISNCFQYPEKYSWYKLDTSWSNKSIWIVIVSILRLALWRIKSHMWCNIWNKSSVWTIFFFLCNVLLLWKFN